MVCDKIIEEKKSQPVSNFQGTVNDAPSAQ